MSLHRLTELLVFLYAGFSTCLAQQDTYARIALTMADYTAASSWIGADHVHSLQDEVVVEVPEHILQTLDQRGIPYRTLVDDLTSFYQEQNKSLEPRSSTAWCGTDPG